MMAKGTIHRKSVDGAPPGHVHRPRRSKPTIKHKAAEAQGKSMFYRKGQKVTLPKAPWADA